MDVTACSRYREEAKQESGTEICGVCVAACPHGRRGQRLGGQAGPAGPERGSVSDTVVPRPGALAMVMDPPICSTRLRATASPIPRPPPPADLDLSTR